MAEIARGLAFVIDDYKIISLGDIIPSARYVIIGGRNFGYDRTSAGYNASLILGKVKIEAIVAESFTRSFLSECLRRGVLPLRSLYPLTEAVKTGDDVSIFVEEGDLRINRRKSETSWCSYPLASKREELEFLLSVRDFGGFEGYLDLASS